MLSYCAYFADGSEYNVNYGPEVDLEKLKDFHRHRLQVLVEADPYLLAFETIPDKVEAQACVELLDEEDILIPSWICFSLFDGENAPSGESFENCLNVINQSGRVSAVGGLNADFFVFRQCTDKAIVVYPNSGEIWDGIAKRWVVMSKCFVDDKFELFTTRWRDAGASLIGGCSQTSPCTIRAIYEGLKEERS